MSKRILTLMAALALMCSVGLQAQTLEELKTMKADKEASLAALQAEVDGINKQIDEFPGWKYGGMGVLGFGLAGNDNWFAIDQPFSSSTNYGISGMLFANLDREKYFWRNSLGANLQELRSKEDENADETKAITDALDIGSLFGYKLSDKWAVSAEAKYLSTILNFNDPGKLTLSAGVTWTPISNLVVLIHPLGYELNFPSGDLVSAAGAKIGATYSTELYKGVNWTSSFNGFVPYTDGEATFADNNGADIKKQFDKSGLINWTWVNGFTTSLWNGLGVGVNIGLRKDNQLADIYSFKNTGVESDNPLQLFYNLGLSYTL